MEDLLKITQDLAREAGVLIVKERATATLTHDYKGGKELVTQADLKADKLICDRITADFPEHKILSEESSPELREVWKLSQ
ncbi:MAG: inositol monophosphatase, partial [Pseudomonadales bacterium]|nr:inositol monophosphatase [Pseudomonadales bacterium]